MRTLACTTALLALFASAGLGLAQDTTTQPANPPQTMTPADCPAPGSVPEAQIPENCKTAAQTGQAPADPATPPADQNATTVDPNAPPADSTTSSTTPATPPAATTQSTLTPADIDVTKAVLASKLIGQTVYSSADESVGEINDLVVDKDKGAVVAVIGVGGFLGIGEKNVAVNLDQITTAMQENNAVKLTISATREQLEAAPAFDPTKITMM